MSALALFSYLCNAFRKGNRVKSADCPRNCKSLNNFLHSATDFSGRRRNGESQETLLKHKPINAFGGKA